MAGFVVHVPFFDKVSAGPFFFLAGSLTGSLSGFFFGVLKVSIRAIIIDGIFFVSLIILLFAINYLRVEGNIFLGAKNRERFFGWLLESAKFLSFSYFGCLLLFYGAMIGLQRLF